MATKTDSSVFDPFKASKYTVHLGAAFRDTPDTSLFSSVRYNYKPQSLSRFTKVNISKDPANEDHFQAEALGEYATVIYNGQRRDAASTYFLTLDHARRIATIEAVDDEYTFNVVSSSDPTDAEDLFRKHPSIYLEQAHTEDTQEPRTGPKSSQLDLLGDDQPDSANPFDYRHYIDSLPEVPSHNTPLPSPAYTPQTSSTPIVQAKKLLAAPRELSQKPAPRSAGRQKSTASVKARRALQPPRKRKPLDTSASDDEALSTAEDAARSAIHRNQTAASGEPKAVQHSARESEQNEGEREGGFIVEGDDDTYTNAMSLGVGNNLLSTPSHAPISLRSAANSVSPTSLVPTPIRLDENNYQNSKLATEESDEDVEELALGSPQIKHSESEQPDANEDVHMKDDTVDGPDEEDFDAVLAALDDDDEDDDATEPPRTRRRSSFVQRSAADESEESEEE